MTPKELAQKLDTDQRTIRKFLRDTVPADDQPGQGGRWELVDDVDEYREAFESWQPKGRVGKPRKTKKEKSLGEAMVDGLLGNNSDEEEFEDFTELSDPELEDLFDDDDFLEVDE
jgi:hypothetical protein